MRMKKTTTSHSSFQTMLKNSVDHLRAKQDCKPSDIGKWLGEIINPASAIFAKRSGRRLRSFVPYNFNVEVHNGKPQLFYYVSWPFASSRGEPPSLASIAPYIPHMVVRNAPYIHVLNCINAEIVLDCETWRNLMPAVIHRYTYEAYVDKHLFPEVKKTCIDFTKILLAHLYPAVTLETLQIAVDLGLVTEDPDVFISWFNNHAHLPEHMSTDLPNNLS